jgi:GTPase SAR1 family protein
LIPNYIKGAKCALIVFDISNKKSFDCAHKWIQMYNDHKNGNGFAFLVGNKTDIDDRLISK